MNQSHTDEQYQLSMHIAALKAIVTYSGSSIPQEERDRIMEVKVAMLQKIKEMNLMVTPQKLFEHIASFYETEH